VKFISYRKSVKSHSQMKDLNKNTSAPSVRIPGLVCWCTTEKQEELLHRRWLVTTPFYLPCHKLAGTLGESCLSYYLQYLLVIALDFL
jgi:hypothetical protein